VEISHDTQSLVLVLWLYKTLHLASSALAQLLPCLPCQPYTLLFLPKCHQHQLLSILHRCKMHTLGPLHPHNLLQRKSPHPVQSGNALTPLTTKQKTLPLVHGKAGMVQRKRRPIGHAFIAKRHILLVTTVCNKYITCGIALIYYFCNSAALSTLYKAWNCKHLYRGLP
jgi:hypothetical protein